MTEAANNMAGYAVESLLSTVPISLRGAVRIGVDIVNIGDLESQLAGRFGFEFQERVFTADEVRASRGVSQKLATRWAVKEAVAKAVGTGFRLGLRPGHIEIVTEQTGSIRVRRTSGAPSWPDAADEWDWTVSATHESGLAMAIALAVGETTRDKRQDHDDD